MNTTYSQGFLPPNCQEVIVRKGDTMYLLAQQYGVSLQELIAANPHIADPNWIYPGQKLCIPTGGALPPGDLSGGGLALLSMEFITPEGLPLPQEGGFVQLAPQTMVLAYFNAPVTHGYLFYTPAGNETFFYTQLLGLAAANGCSMLQFHWPVSPALHGSVYVVACAGDQCIQGPPVPVFSPQV